ncbi:MAG: tetratricopeptide repeat protein [Burkholderiales bacterium]|nr:tetratricopeptide repeat protein [Burkholderiales bacterium]MDE2565236.1 tetratricopeptide repeat protein [Burkholderiales bacterium]
MAEPAFDGPLSFDVTEADFESAVLERSLEVPVLLDCWAPWCGPCRSLGPVLERLVQAYGGRFVLAKLDTDQAPNVSAALQIRSIPLVMLFIGGQPVDQFLGALPEGKVREFLDRHLTEPVSPVESLRAEAAGLPDDEALPLLHEALSIEPGHVEATLDLAERLIGQGALDEARGRLEGLPGEAMGHRYAALLGRIELALHRPEGDPAALAARVAANPKDFEARFALAALLAHDGRWPAAFEQLLDTVLRDKAEWREKARVQLVAWFDVCPDAEAVSRGRRYLGMYLN